jgi:hypothetical protein
MTFVIVANAVAVAVCVALLSLVMRRGYLVAGGNSVLDREPTPIPVEQRGTLERAA